jgi:methionyl-tRNA formyltransferase
MPNLIITWLEQGHQILWVHDPKDVVPVDVYFLLGCGQLVSSATMALFKHNLVVHESDLPLGKGWSPLTWQILEGENKISAILIETAEKVGSGPIYLQKSMHFKGNELIDELRQT